MDYTKAIQRVWSDHPEEINSNPESGGLLIQARIVALAQVAANSCLGDLIEIGAWRGWTTAPLGLVAARFGRKLIVADPWLRDDVYQDFLSSIHHVKSVISIYKMRSQDENFIGLIRTLSPCFVFVDGEHSYEAVRRDLETVQHCNGLIAVDDYSWDAGIRKAVDEFVLEYDRRLLYSGVHRECYIQ